MNKGINSIREGITAIVAYSSAIVALVIFLTQLSFGLILGDLNDTGMVKRENFNVLWETIDNKGGVAAVCQEIELSEASCEAISKFKALENDPVALSRIDAVSESGGVYFAYHAIEIMKAKNVINTEYLAPAVHSLSGVSSDYDAESVKKVADAVVVEVEEAIYQIILNVSLMAILIAFFVSLLLGWVVSTPSLVDNIEQSPKKKWFQYLQECSPQVAASSPHRAVQLLTGIMQKPVIKRAFTVGISSAVTMSLAPLLLLLLAYTSM